MSTTTRSPVRAVMRHETNLRQLELRITRTLDGMLHGEHRSATSGAGSDPEDAHVYRPGDDARRIDWSLSARTNEVHVRRTTAERELDTWLVLDTTPSLDFGTAGWEKRDLALAAAASFGLLGARPGNRTAAVSFDGHDLRIVPPRAGRDAVMALLRRLDRSDVPSHASDADHRGESAVIGLADALRRTRGVATRRGRVVVISDLMDRGPWLDELRMLAVRHDVVVAEVSDPREDELAPVGLLTLVDPETGHRFEVQTDDAELRARFASAAAERRDAVARGVRTSGARHLCLSTDRDWLLDLVRFTVRGGAHRRLDRIAS